MDTHPNAPLSPELEQEWRIARIVEQVAEKFGGKPASIRHDATANAAFRAIWHEFRAALAASEARERALREALDGSKREWMLRGATLALDSAMDCAHDAIHVAVEEKNECDRLKNFVQGRLEDLDAARIVDAAIERGEA